MLFRMSSLVKPLCSPISQWGTPRRSSEGSKAGWFVASESTIMGEGALRGGDVGRGGSGSNDSIPGKRTDDDWLAVLGLAVESGGPGW